MNARRLIGLICLCLAVPAAAQAAPSATYTGPFDAKSEAATYDLPGMSSRNVIDASANATAAGVMTGMVSVRSQYGGQIPLASSNNAEASNDLSFVDHIPEGTLQVTYVVHVLVNHVSVSREKSQVVPLQGASAHGWLSASVSGLECECDKQPTTEFFAYAGDSQIPGGFAPPDGSDIVTRATISAYDSHVPLPAGPVQVLVNVSADATTSFVESAASLSYDLRLTRVDVYYLN